MIDPEHRDDLHDRPVTLRMQNMPAIDALNWACVIAGADWDVVNGVIFISTRETILRRRIVPRVYDVRPLLLVLQNYRGPGLSVDDALANTTSGGSGSRMSASEVRESRGGEGLFGDDSEEAEEGLTRSELLLMLQQLIENTVGDPMDWASAGGDLFSISEIRNNMIVRATPEMHEQIEALLRDLQAANGRTVAVDADFFVLPRKTLQERLPRNGSRVLSGTEADAFLANLGDSVRRLASGRTICFNAQRVFVYAGHDRTFVSDIESVPDGNGPDVTLSTLRSGAVVDVMPVINLDGDAITLVVKSDLTTGGAGATKAVPVGAVASAQEVRVTTDGSLYGEVKPPTGEASRLEGSSTGSARLTTPGTVALGVVEMDAPEQDIVSHRTAVRVPNDGAVLLSGVSPQLMGINAAESEVVLLLRARVWNSRLIRVPERPGPLGLTPSQPLRDGWGHARVLPRRPIGLGGRLKGRTQR